MPNAAFIVPLNETASLTTQSEPEASPSPLASSQPSTHHFQIVLTGDSVGFTVSFYDNSLSPGTPLVTTIPTGQSVTLTVDALHARLSLYRSTNGSAVLNGTIYCDGVIESSLSLYNNGDNTSGYF